MILHLRTGDRARAARRDQAPDRAAVLAQRVDFHRGTFRVRGDVVDIFPAEHAENAVRVEFFDDEVESLQLFDPLTGHVRQQTLALSPCIPRSTT